MGCSHSVRKNENVRSGKSKLQGEISKYRNYDYAERPQN